MRKALKNWVGVSAIAFSVLFFFAGDARADMVVENNGTDLTIQSSTLMSAGAVYFKIQAPNNLATSSSQTAYDQLISYCGGGFAYGGPTTLSTPYDTHTSVGYYSPGDTVGWYGLLISSTNVCPASGNFDYAVYYWNGTTITNLLVVNENASTPQNTPYFVEPYSPANGSYTSQATTTFSAQYETADNTSYDTLDFQIIDLTNASSSPVTFPTVVDQSGAITETNQISLTAGDSYLWRPIAYSSTNGNLPRINGNWYSYTASSSAELSLNTAYNATLGTSTLPSTTNFLTFLNVPYLLQTKVPFAYIFQIAGGIVQGIESTSSSALPSGAFVWSGIGTGTTTTDFFSTSTVEYYLSPTLISAWRAFLLVVLTIDFGYALYHTARKQLKI